MSVNQSKINGPFFWIPTLYFAEGVPAAIVAEVSILIFKSFSMTDTLNIFWSNFLGLLPLLLIKFFWAPVIDSVLTKRIWILLTQTAMGICFAAAAVCCGLNTTFALPLLIAAFLLAAFFSATHDVAADGFYILALSEHDQALFSGLRSVFFRVAMIAANGGLVMLAGLLGEAAGFPPRKAWMVALCLPGAFFLLLAFYHSFAIPRTEKDAPAERASFFKEFRDVFVSFLRKPHIGTALVFLLFYRLAEAQLGGVSKLFLLDGIGLSEMRYGFLTGILGVGMLLAGGVAAGFFTAKFGMGKLFRPMALAINAPNLLYLYLAYFPTDNLFILGSSIAIEQFGYGFGFTGFMLFMVSFAAGSGARSTSHYALMTIFMILGLRLPGMGAGWILDSVSSIFGPAEKFKIFFIWVMICTIPGFLVTELARKITPPGFGRKQ